ARGERSEIVAVPAQAKVQKETRGRRVVIVEAHCWAIGGGLQGGADQHRKIVDSRGRPRRAGAGPLIVERQPAFGTKDLIDLNGGNLRDSILAIGRLIILARLPAGGVYPKRLWDEREDFDRDRIKA